MKIHRLLPLFILLLMHSEPSQAQHSIEPRLLYADTSTFPFTSEWQYLSTDIFLLDPNHFERVVNEMEFYKPKKRSWRRKRPEERLEYLFITASLKNARFLGESEVTYPLYNFRVQTGEDAKYQMLTSENIDHVRILDNLPLYSANDQIDAQIGVHIITQSNEDHILSLVATQLKNISKILTPSTAVMSLVQEFGNLLEANTKRKEYHFSSTIRLFEQKNFDTRVHSMKVYSLESAQSVKDSLDGTDIHRFLDTVGVGRQDRATIRSLVGARAYPTVVVVNYKSLYRMEPVSGDEVNFSNIEQRRLKVENDFRQNLINVETYRQERDFLNFLTVFATFKNHLDVYKLNNRTGNTDAIAGSLFSLMQQYMALRKAVREMGYKYKDNKTYATVFKPEYEAIMGYAMLYMDDDHNLKSTKKLVAVMLRLAEGGGEWTVMELEEAITDLQFAEHFKAEMMESQPEGQEIRSSLQRLEEDLYLRAYAEEVQRLERTRASLTNRNAAQDLLTRVGNTSCRLCRERAIEAINQFGRRMDTVYREESARRLDSLRTSLSPWLYVRIDSVRMLRERFTQRLAADDSEVSRFVNQQLEVLERDLFAMRELMSTKTTSLSLRELDLLQERITMYRGRIGDALGVVRSMAPSLLPEDEIEAQPPNLEPEAEPGATPTHDPGP